MQDLMHSNGKMQREWKKILYTLIAGSIIFLAAEIHNDRLYTITSLAFYVIGAFIDPIIPLCLNIIISPVALPTNTIINMFIMCIIALPAIFVYLLNKNKYINKQDLLIILYVCLFLGLSTILGYQTNYVTAIVQLFAILQYTIVCNINNESKNYLIYFSLILSGVLIAITVILQLIDGSAIFLHGGDRLTYDGSVRTLSTALSLPIYYLLSRYILPQKKRLGIFKEIVLFIIMIVMAGLLILTYSRGVLISVIIAVSYIIFVRKSSISVKQLLSYFILFVGLILLIVNIDIDTDLLFHNITNGNGRTEIWRTYFKRLSESGPLNFIWGFGPGESQRIIVGTQFDGYYVHSAILDYFFSFGLLGLGFFVFMIVRGFIQAKKHGNIFAQGLLILTILVFATSNIASSMQMHVMLALVYSTSLASIRDSHNCAI